MMIDRAWEAEVGGLAKFARIVAVDRESLVVEVNSSSAMHELALRKKELVRRMNQHFHPPFIKWLTLRTA